MKSRLIILVSTAIAAALGATGACAHHAFAAEFDREKPIDLEGTVTKVEWTNPHARFYVDAPDPDLDGEIVNWNFELGSPNGLMRAGWRPDSLKPGDEISVSGWRARNNAHVANARTVTDRNGRRLFAGSSAEAQESD
jgi:hypothetical protein